MGVIIGFGALVLVIIWFVAPFMIISRITGLVGEIRALKNMLQQLISASDTSPSARQKGDVAEPSPVEAVVPARAVEPPVVTAVPSSTVEPPVDTAVPSSTVEQRKEAREPAAQPAVGTDSPARYTREPTAFDVFWSRIEDWLAVRGDFAPPGVTREFAIATRWLVRVGAILLIGATAYFLMLAIDHGWIGPAQRVYGMMFWGMCGIVAGTWIKLKKERYAILGETCAALGLVALYLSFGLGHRFFTPPVIASYAVAFVGLVVTTAAAGCLSVGLRSPMTAVLGLIGGLLVPMIVPISEPSKLQAYLLVLTFGACIVAQVRRWSAYAFAAITAAFVITASSWTRQGEIDKGVFVSVLYLLALAVTLGAARHRSRDGNNFCWTFVAVSSIFWLGTMELHCFPAMETWSVCSCLVAASAVHAVSAVVCRRRQWQVGDGVPVLLCLAVGLSAFALLYFLGEHGQWKLAGFCLFAAVLAELYARSGEETLGVLSLLAMGACAVFGMFYVVPPSYAMIAREGYWTAFLGRLVRLWCLPALAAFLGCRLKDDGIRSSFPYAICHVVAVLTGLVLLTCESHWFGTFFLPALKGGTVTIAWALVAFAGLSAGILCRRRFPRLVGLWLLAAAVVKLLLFDTASLSTLGRVGTFGLVGVALIAGAFLYLKFKSKFEESGNLEKDSQP